MMFSIKVAWRYLTSNRTQTALLLGGVAIGVLVFVFMTALIGGLRLFLIAQTTGSIAHVTLEPPDRIAREISGEGGSDTTRLVARETSTTQRKQIFAWQSVLDIVERTPGVRVASPQINGNAFLIKGQATSPVLMNGLRPDRLDAISAITPKIIRGEAQLNIDGILIGEKLANNLGLRIGQPVVVRTDRGRERTLTVRAIYKTGIGSLDERVAFVNIQLARTLLDLPQGISQIEIKADDVNAAPAIADALTRATSLKATSWVERNAQLFVALNSQAQTGNLIQIFSLITIVIGVSSALLLTTYRRRGEIAIMRSMGVSRAFIVTIFILQGLFIGLLGAGLGAWAGYGFCTFLADISRRSDGSAFPIDPAQGGYLAVIVLTTLGSVLAAILPARAASKVDPVEVLNQ
ncbi:MAG: ABC transporter permease [Alphaproteobacteria bacterium]|nr:ABC transporter permease [Alphaproteobacteria bacterium]